MTFDPLLTVVVPTASRPTLLPRAVASALRAAPDGRVEVIVVPNGPDASWRTSLAAFHDDPRVRCAPVERANANVARNHGLWLARGTFVRFLDDDDVLLNDGARMQLEALIQCGAEACSGEIDVVGDDGGFLRRMPLLETDDLFCAMIRPRRVCLPTAHVFRRDALGEARWNEQLSVEQDTDWMFRLAAGREWNWITVPFVVGRWVHHAGNRTSKSITRATRARLSAGMMVDAMQSLERRGALTVRRADALSEGLWHYGHAHFPQAPVFWTRMLRVALRLSPRRRPNEPFFQQGWLCRVDPLLIEWILMPPRVVSNVWRRWSRRR